jgi:predicted dienelactone hydrolase
VGLVLVLLAAAYVGYVFVQHDKRVSLPAPTGRYGVGRALYTWTDSSRPDPLSPADHAGPRRLSVWLWFPSDADASPGAPYLPGAWGGLHLPGPLGWAETAFGKVDPHTQARPRVAAGRFPVVVLLPGLGFAAPQYTSLAVDLASQGYLVAGVTPTYSANLTVLDGRPVHASSAGNPSSFSGEHSRSSTPVALRLMHVWAADARFAVRRLRVLGTSGRFAGHVDAGQVAYVGHSFGGTSALEACRGDSHCVAAVDLDGAEFGPVVSHGLPVPLLLVGHENSCITALCTPASASERIDLSVARRLVAHSRGHAWSVSIDDTLHFDFSDYAAYYLAFPLRAVLPLGRRDGRRALRITGSCLDRFLAGAFGREQARAPITGHPNVHVRSW